MRRWINPIEDDISVEVLCVRSSRPLICRESRESTWSIIDVGFLNDATPNKFSVWARACSRGAGPPFTGSSAQLTRRPYQLRAWTQAGWPSWRRPAPTWRKQWSWSALVGCRRSCWPGRGGAGSRRSEREGQGCRIRSRRCRRP